MISDKNESRSTTSSINRSISIDIRRESSKNKVLLNTPISPVSRTSFLNRTNSIDINNRFIKIWIETLIGSAYEVFILPDEPIFNLKLKLEKEENIPLLYQTLYYGDDELNDSFTIEEYSIEYGATLRLQVQKNNEESSVNRFQSNNLEPNFSVDEITYNLLFDDTDAQKKKCSSLTDSKSIDEFRLVNASSNLGCISVNENKFDQSESGRNSNEKQNKMDQLLIKMQNFKLPNLANEEKFNEFHNKGKRLSSQFEIQSLSKKSFKFDSRFRSNSSFNLVDYEQNEASERKNDQIKRDHQNDANEKRRSSIPLIDRKQIFKLNIFDKQKKSDQSNELKNNSKNNSRSNVKIPNQNHEIKIQKLTKDHNNNGQINCKPLPGMKLPPVDKKKEKAKVQKCSICKKNLNAKNSSCKCEQVLEKTPISNNMEKSNETASIRLSAVKNKKLLPKI